MRFGKLIPPRIVREVRQGFGKIVGVYFPTDGTSIPFGEDSYEGPDAPRKGISSDSNMYAISMLVTTRTTSLHSVYAQT